MSKDKKAYPVEFIVDLLSNGAIFSGNRKKIAKELEERFKKWKNK